MIFLSLDTNVDPTKPDLLGDISDNVQTENARNLQNAAELKNGDGASSQNGCAEQQNGDDLPNGHANGELEKGTLDSISNKSEENSQASIKQSPIQRLVFPSCFVNVFRYFILTKFIVCTLCHFAIHYAPYNLSNIF